MLIIGFDAALDGIAYDCRFDNRPATVAGGAGPYPA